MFTIKSDRRTQKIADLAEFNTHYFAYLHMKIDAVGMENGKEVFRIENGKEINPEKSRLFASRPDEWRKPSGAELVGALNQFKNLSALARLMGVSRAAISLWKQKGETAQISFLSWRFLCEYLGIRSELTHNLEFNDIIQKNGAR